MLLDDKIVKIREDFSYLNEQKLGRKIIYLDNAATSQKPNCVIDAVSDYYKYQNANPHRGAHYLTVKATEAYENARSSIAKFINAKSSDEIIFTRNTTESLNLIAYSYALENLKKDDEILITILEHHSNFTTWHYVAEKTGAKLKIVYLDDNFSVDMTDFENKLTSKTKLVSVTGASNVTSCMPDIEKIVELSHKNGAIVVVDGAQLAPHKKVDMQKINCDFFAISGHKMLSPMGIGILYGKKDILDNMKPFMYGGEMIEYVYEDHSTFTLSPTRFEAGTMNVGGAIGLAKAIEYMEAIGMDNIYERERQLSEYAVSQLNKIPYIDIYYPQNAKNVGSAIAFNVKEIHPHDVASILDNFNIAVRSGHHCAMPLHKYLKINASCRASISFYNTKQEIDEFLTHLEDVRRTLGYGLE